MRPPALSISPLVVFRVRQSFSLSLHMIVLTCGKAQYHVPNGTTAEAGNELGVFEGIDQHYSKADLDGFFSTLYP